MASASASPEEAAALSLLAEDRNVDTDVGAAEGLDDASLLDNPSALWFKREAFLAPEFDPDQYVKDLQRLVCPSLQSKGHSTPSCDRHSRLQVPLEALRAALNAHQSALKNEARLKSLLFRLPRSAAHPWHSR